MKLARIAVLLLLASAVACGGGSSSPQQQQQQPPPAQAVSVTITPSSAAVLVNQGAQLSATVTGTSNTAVTWSMQETKDAGAIGSKGLYTAPWVTGTFHVIATSVADTTKSATATMAVSAEFGFIQQLPGGISTTSVTPITGIFGPDGKFTTQNVIDTNTSKPADTGIYNLFLSADGTKGVFDLLQGTSQPAWNVFTAKSDGKGLTQLTNNNDPNTLDGDPQFSPDGKLIVYIHQDNNTGSTIWLMNSDGSNQHQISSSSLLYAWNPSFSPDGKQIVAEAITMSNTEVYDGVLVMNADGTNPIQLTGGPDPASCALGWDETPTFTNDGKSIAFSQLCVSNVTDSVFIRNSSGAITQLHGNTTPGFVSCQPRAVGNKLVFSSNVDTQGSSNFELYSIMPDGSGMTRLTNNTVYDGLSAYWMDTSGSGTSTKRRLEHQKILRNLRGNR